MDNASLALQIGIYANLPIMAWVGVTLWNIDRRLTVVETILTHKKGNKNEPD